MRDTTERPEGSTPARSTRGHRRTIRPRSLELLSPPTPAAMSEAVNPYGDGRASIRCVAAIEHHFGLSERLPDFVPVSASQ